MRARVRQCAPGEKRGIGQDKCYEQLPGTGTASRDEEDLSASLTSGEPLKARDATKRIRVKRSRDRMRQSSAKSPKTPLLDGLHQTIDFNADPDSLTTPLPLVYVPALLST